MGQVVTIGLDIAKSVFQVHGVDAEGGVVIRQKLTRARLLKFFEKLDPCLVGIEACGTSHHWARELIGLGHDVRLMPPSYVKPYVKRQKNDMADAEGICEAVTRPTMRFVPVKSPEQQSVMVLHRTRLILTRQRTQLSNAIRGHMAEFGLAAPIGRQGLQTLIEVINDSSDERVPVDARGCLAMLAAQMRLVNEQILETDRQIRTHARSTEVGRRLMEIPGVGPLLASALVGTIADPKAFKTGRTRSAHRTGDAIVGHQALELLAGILSTLVGVVQQGIGLAAPPDRHDQCVGDELGRHGVAHRPADDAPREQVDHGRNIQPAFGGPDVGEVGHVGARFGASAVNWRSSTLPAITDRSPLSLGSPRRRDRAFSACRRINRSTRCRPHDRPSARRSCQTRRAP